MTDSYISYLCSIILTATENKSLLLLSINTQKIVAETTNTNYFYIGMALWNYLCSLHFRQNHFHLVNTIKSLVGGWYHANHILKQVNLIFSTREYVFKKELPCAMPSFSLRDASTYSNHNNKISCTVPICFYRRAQTWIDLKATK